MLAEQCAHGACSQRDQGPGRRRRRGRAPDHASGPLRGASRRAGQAPRDRTPRPGELSFLITAGDLNPFLQARCPAAITAARRGDTGLLLRLRRIGQGGQTRAEDLSFGLNVDHRLHRRDAAVPARRAGRRSRGRGAQPALAAIPPTDYAPFDAQTVLQTSYVDDCLYWPHDAIRQPFTGPLPDVPALLLGGRLDTRTPLENARATAPELPHSTIVALKGSGHDVLDSDITGCTAQALARFIDDVAVGHPCLDRDNGVRRCRCRRTR